MEGETGSESACKQWLELKDHVLPGLIATISGVKHLSIWSAGCCDGEEPFTLKLVNASGKVDKLIDI